MLFTKYFKNERFHSSCIVEFISTLLCVWVCVCVCVCFWGKGDLDEFVALIHTIWDNVFIKSLDDESDWIALFIEHIRFFLFNTGQSGSLWNVSVMGSCAILKGAQWIRSWVTEHISTYQPKQHVTLASIFKER